MGEVVVYAEMQNLDFGELLNEFGQFDPKAFTAVLRQLNEGLLISSCLSKRSHVVDGFSGLLLLRLVVLLGMDDVVFAEAVVYQL